MKTTLLLLASCWLLHTSQAQSITDITQQSTPLSSLSGKKILVLLLPSQPDTAITGQLLRFQQRYTDSVRVIGLVPPEEAQLQPEALASVYAAAMAAGVIISTGTTTPGDNEREAVLKWLSDKNNNRAQLPDLAGSKYFISRTGRMYAQVDAFTNLEAPLVNNLARTRVPGE